MWKWNPFTNALDYTGDNQNLWDRTGTVLSPHNVGDSITLKSDTYRYGVGNVPFTLTP